MKNQSNILAASVAVFLCIAGVGSTLVTAGCGGSGSPAKSATQSRNAQASITIVWPDRASKTRLIPVAANSLKVTLQNAAGFTTTQVAVRPATGSSSTLTFSNIPVGNLTATATAHSDAAGATLPALAQGSSAFVGNPSEPFAITLTLNSTIESLVVVPSPVSVEQGSSLAVTASARNAAGETVITASTYAWSVADTAVATVSGAAPTATVNGVAVGSSTLTVTELESGKAISVPLTVTAALTPTPTPTPTPAPRVTIDFANVGNPGNAGDPNAFGKGAVAYEFRIGKFEVTNAQYAIFLNNVAASDPNSLFNASMGADPRGGITRTGSDGSFTYSVRPNMGDKPVNFVSFFDAARMSNWLTNGQGSGSTESGAYTLSGNTLTAITRDPANPNQFFLPTQDEFVKAGYHQPASQGGDTDNFWLFATRSNSSPVVGTATATGVIANPGATTVNIHSGSDWNGQNGNLTTVGSAGSSSFYGAFDMNGNVREWIQDTAFNQGFRGQMGGDWTSGWHADPKFVFGLDPAFVNYNVPTIEGVDVGFRLYSFSP